MGMWILAGLIALIWLAVQISTGDLDAHGWARLVIPAIVIGGGLLLGRRWARRHGRSE